jgi:hypothetical protein
VRAQWQYLHWFFLRSCGKPLHSRTPGQPPEIQLISCALADGLFGDKTRYPEALKVPALALLQQFIVGCYLSTQASDKASGSFSVHCVSVSYTTDLFVATTSPSVIAGLFRMEHDRYSRP